jgi:hypothetical protein
MLAFLNLGKVKSHFGQKWEGKASAKGKGKKEKEREGRGEHKLQWA